MILCDIGFSLKSWIFSIYCSTSDEGTQQKLKDVPFAPSVSKSACAHITECTIVS